MSDYSDKIMVSEEEIQPDAKFLYPLMVWKTGVDGLYHYFNSSWLEFTGQRLTTKLGEQVYNLWACCVHPEDRQECEDTYHIASAAYNSFQRQYRLRRFDGDYRWVFDTAVPKFAADGSFSGYNGYCMDITIVVEEHTRQLEAALDEFSSPKSQLIQTEKMSSLGELVAGVAHEINNPVNFIYGNIIYISEYISDLLKLVKLYRKYNSQPVPEIRNFIKSIDLDFIQEDLPKVLESMNIGAERIRGIVLSISNFSHLNEAVMKPVDIHEGIDSTLLLLQHRLKAKPGCPEIKVVKEYGNLPEVNCYGAQINQVFMNLLANAIDSLEESVLSCTSNEPPEIRIRTFIQGGNQVMICITDNGAGITPELQSRLFEPFFTTKPVGKGTGMGLSISYQIVVENHQGELRCISTVGRGAEFIIAIPL